jgi:hypothetical protein
MRIAVIFMALGVIGCGDDDSRGGGTCGAGRTGVTECFTSGGNSCSAGQYCDMSSGFNECVAGCTSDSNCGAGDRCSRGAGEAVGVCAPCTPVGTSDAGPPASNIEACRGAAEELGFCMALTPPQVAELQTACASVLNESQRTLLVDCVNAALGNCAAAASCVPGAGGCGNGTCDAGETPASCPGDCTAGGCGNGTCDAGETPASCPGDCEGDNLAECRAECDSYAFFECLAPGGLDACYSSCAAATPASRQQFINCAATGTVSCEESCFAFLP